MIIDAYTHILPMAYKKAVISKVPRLFPPLSTLWDTLKTLTDVNLRLDIMDEYGIDMHGLAAAAPPIETLFQDRTIAKEMARLQNDSLAEIVQAHPNRFFGIATVSMLDPDDAVEEVTRCVKELGFAGVQIYSNVAGRPIDDPRYEIFYDTVEQLNIPVWLHPNRTAKQADYEGEDESKYLLWQVLGWPYETSIAMARLVFSGIMQRHPDLKVICHHAGAMIPFFSNRIKLLYPKTESMTESEFAPGVSKPYIDHFKRFYVDTVVQGNVSSLLNAMDFFGADHMIFASDMPFDIEMGREFTRVSLESVSQLPVSDAIKSDIHSLNLKRICPIR